MTADGRAVEAVCVFDLNMPRDKLKEHFESVAPEVLLFFLAQEFVLRTPGSCSKKKRKKDPEEDIRALARALVVQKQYSDVPCYFVTRDKKFKIHSRYNADLHPIRILVVSFMSNDAIPLVVERVTKHIRALAVLKRLQILLLSIC